MKRYLRGDSIRNYLLVKDLLRLKFSDVWDERSKMTERVHIREQKTGKEKIFRLNETAQKAIKEYIAKPSWNLETIYSRPQG